MRKPRIKRKLRLESPFKPSGDQPQAIEQLVEGLNAGKKNQVLLGVTGSGKTFTMANVIEQTQRPALIMTHNKTLAAQLFSEMKSFFPQNAVEYFVSYYDYYQPEAYVPSSNTYIEKDASVNQHIEHMRLSATKALLENSDAIVVASVSAIYGLGDPSTLLEMVIQLEVGQVWQQRDLLKALSDLQYRRNQMEIDRGEFRVRGEVIEIFPADSETYALRVVFFDEEIESIDEFDPLTAEIIQSHTQATIHPTTHYVTNQQKVKRALITIQEEFIQRHQELHKMNKLVEAQRLEQKVRLDMEMLNELGFCHGIENYSRHFTGALPGDPPPTLMDYLPENTILFIDESHVSLPQFGGMYRGDRSRKQTLVEHGFRLPSALDNRPLRFDEFLERTPQTVFVSATPSQLELEKAQNQWVEQVIRPTGLLDPKIEIKSSKTQIDDLLGQIKRCAIENQRVLVTTLTKKMSEQLSDYLNEQGVKACYLHSDIDTIERTEIIRQLRLGVYDALIGINLLREGLDIPEVSLVAILDADHEGFLRSEVALIQTIGRAARHEQGRVILYAEKITPSMQRAMDETQRRREKQMEHNQAHHITPQSVKKSIRQSLEEAGEVKVDDLSVQSVLSADQFKKEVKNKQKQMREHAQNLNFEKAAQLRDEIKSLEKNFYQS